MLAFILDKDIPEDIEIIIDEQGIEEFIQYLGYIKKTKEHIHLLIDNELNNISFSNEDIVSAKKITIKYHGNIIDKE